MFCTWQMARRPRALIARNQGRGSPNASRITGTSSARAKSKGARSASTKGERNPIPNGRAVVARTLAMQSAK
jgi:hypothetical protein